MLFTFPSRYLFTIGRIGVLRLGEWSPHVQTGFHGPRPTQVPSSTCTCTGLSPAKARLSRRFQLINDRRWPDPRSLATTNGVSVISFPLGTKMFQFPRFASRPYGFRSGYPCGWVAPFGHPGIKAFWRLPQAFRSLTRPSSPLCAKAFAKRPSHTSKRPHTAAKAALCAINITRPKQRPRHAD